MANLIFTLLAFVCCAFMLGNSARAAPGYARECVTAHNKLRERHDAGSLRWDNGLARSAQKWAEHLEGLGHMEHDPRHTSEHFGENLYQIGGAEPTCEDAVQMWYDEIEKYRKYGYCRRPPHRFEQRMMGVLHFTQLVWKGTKKVGVGIAGGFIVARYSPPGNTLGRFAQNVEC